MFSTIEREARALVVLPVVLLAIGIWLVARTLLRVASWFADIHEESDTE